MRNRFFTSHTTSFEKNRWSAAAAVLGGVQQFLINQNAVNFMAKKFNKPPVTNYLSKLKGERAFFRDEIEKLFEDLVFKTLEKKQLDIVRTGCAVGELQSKQLVPPVNFIISDDAPNFVRLAKNHQLYWVHEIRKYKLCEVFKRIESENLEMLVKEWRNFYGLMLEESLTNKLEVE